jgi:hypothetical protein
MDARIDSKTAIGGGVGAIVGFMLGGPIGAVFGTVLGGGIAHISPRNGKGVLTDKRRLIYEQHMLKGKDPAALRTLADAFDAEGLKAHAEMLRKRANLRELPKEVRDARRDAFRRALASDKVDVIEALATEWENEGATDAAATLREHAAAVKMVQASGKSAKPMGNKDAVEAFADKLAKTIMHYGTDSVQSRSAASNLLQAQGQKPTQKTIGEAIAVAASEIALEMPAAAAATPATATPPAAAPPAAAAGEATPEPAAKTSLEAPEATPAPPDAAPDAAPDASPDTAPETVPAPPIVEEEVEAPRVRVAEETSAESELAFDEDSPEPKEASA